jgi:hypothetical protein
MQKAWPAGRAFLIGWCVEGYLTVAWEGAPAIMLPNGLSGFLKSSV